MSFDKYTSTASVKAEQIEEARSVITPNGPLAAQVGQWEVRYPDGNVQVVDDEQFTATFERGGAEEEEEVQPTVGPESVPNSEPETEEEKEGEKGAEPDSEPKAEPKADKTMKAPPRTR